MPFHHRPHEQKNKTIDPGSACLTIGKVEDFMIKRFSSRRSAAGWRGGRAWPEHRWVATMRQGNGSQGAVPREIVLNRHCERSEAIHAVLRVASARR
jgi:hypothetical protein